MVHTVESAIRVPTEIATSKQSTTDKDDDDSSVKSYVCKFNPQSSRWECTVDYKKQILQQVIDRHDNNYDGRATIDQLKDFGITVYLAEQDSVNIDILTKVVQHASTANTDRSRPDYENQRCLLYRDDKGRLYNLTLANGCAGLGSTWKSLLISFSGLQALVALAVLTRAFSCYNDATSVTPGYLSLLLGLILYEEMSHVWVNCSMFVRGTPSIAAYTLLSNFDSDWPRKLAIFVLALASAQEPGSNAQKYATLSGIAFAMSILAANLGSRAWYFMKWKPIGQGGIFAPIISFFVAMLTGLIFPYMGFTQIQAGGKAAVQLVIINCIIVATLFVISDLDAVQSFIVVGSNNCNQDNTNISLGIYFAMTSITCIFAAQKISPPEPHPEDNDPILIEDQTSPVGFKVPNFPDYPVDPIFFGGNGLSCCSLKVEIILGLAVSILIGAFVVSTGLYDYLENFNEIIEDSV